MKINAICVLLIILFGCNKPKESSVEIDNVTWSILDSIKFESFNEDLLIPYPISMFVTDSLIIIQDYQGGKAFFYALDRFRGVPVMTFANRGNGNEEVISASNNYLLSDASDTVWIYDDTRKRLMEFNIKGRDIVLNNKQNMMDIEEYSKGWIKDIYNIKDNILFSLGCSGVFDNSRFLITEGNKNTTCVKNPNMDKYLSEKDKLSDLFYGPSHFKVNKRNKKAAFGTYKGGLFQIFDLSKLPQEIVTDTTLLLCVPYEGASDHREIRFGFEDIFVTDKYIYALYNGKNSVENEYFARDILVFNWDGTPKIRLLSDLYLKCLCIDEKAKEIFAVGYDQERSFFLVKTQFNIN